MSHNRLFCFLLVLHISDSRAGIEEDGKDPDGCNGVAHGITSCSEGFTTGDNGGKQEIFIQANQYTATCANSCKNRYSTSVGITESLKQQYSSGPGKNKNKCWCEFGQPKLNARNEDYATCMFKLSMPSQVKAATKEPPKYLVVSSNGSAATVRSERMGRYKLQNESHNSFPVWKKEGGEQYIFVSKKHHWGIGPNVNIDLFGVLNYEDNPAPLFPHLAAAWMYWDGQQWKTDDTLQVFVELELRGGSTPSEGNVYVVNSEKKLSPVCDAEWRSFFGGHANARVVCRQLGYADGVETVDSHFESVRDGFEINHVNCRGDEARLQDCRHLNTVNYCHGGDGAGVICFDIPIVLRGGSIPSEGNVHALNSEEILGPVCDDNWGNADARVVCRQLGYADGVATKESHFGSVLDDFAMDNVNCQGDEARLQDCRYSTSDNCYGDEAAGVKCSNITLDHSDEIIIPEDVVVESGCSSTQFACADGLRCISAGFICDLEKDCADGSDELGSLCLGCNSTEFGCSDWSECIPAESTCNGRYDCPDGLDESASTCGGCKPTEIACEDNGLCKDRSEEFRSICGDCSSTEFACVNGWQCVEGELKCDGNKDCKDGSDEYASVCGGCDDSTQFACADGTQCIPAKKRCNRGYPDCKDGSDEFRSICGACNAWEFECANGYQCIAAIFKCDGVKDCFDYSDEFSDFPSQCGSSEVTTAYPPLLKSMTPRSSHVELRGGDSANRGNVYAVNTNKKFGPVCDGSWDHADARVVCRQLGYKNGIAHTNSRFGPVNPNHAIAMGGVGCRGGETRIQDCDYMTVCRSYSALASNGAGVTCYDDYEIIDLVELIGGNSSSEGIAHAANREEEFGPICSDGFGDEEARVVCRQLGFGSGVATTIPMMGLHYSMANVIGGGLPMTYPKFGWVGHEFSMGDVVCVGDEDRIQDCQIGQINYNRYVKCPSGKGAGVRCNN